MKTERETKRHNVKLGDEKQREVQKKTVPVQKSLVCYSAQIFIPVLRTFSDDTKHWSCKQSTCGGWCIKRAT